MKNKVISLCIIIFATLIVCSPGSSKSYKQKEIPPGLQKKIIRGEELPPGWQKKLVKGEILDIEIYNQGKVIAPVDKRGLITIKVEDKTIRLIKATREIVDVINN